MIDRSMLIDALLVSGLKPESSDKEILQILSALGYEGKDKKEALKIIRTKFPAPSPYFPAGPKDTAPKERIKIPWIKEDVEESNAVVTERIKIPWVADNEEAPKNYVLMPRIKIPRVADGEEEPKNYVALPRIKIPTVVEEKDTKKRFFILPPRVKVTSADLVTEMGLPDKQSDPNLVTPRKSKFFLINLGRKQIYEIEEGTSVFGVKILFLCLFLVILCFPNHLYVDAYNFLVSKIGTFLSRFL